MEWGAGGWSTRECDGIGVDGKGRDGMGALLDELLWCVMGRDGRACNWMRAK